MKSFRPVKITESLKEELEHWKFLDSRNGFFPLRKEKRFVVKVIPDASNSGWGGILSLTESSKYKEIKRLEHNLVSTFQDCSYVLHVLGVVSAVES